jgi:hypothetical protein
VKRSTVSGLADVVTGPGNFELHSGLGTISLSKGIINCILATQTSMKQSFRSLSRLPLLYRSPCLNAVVPSCRKPFTFNVPRRPAFMVNTPTSGFASVMTQVHRVTDDLEKPALDDRSYRVIRLPNNLEALLVHDPDTDKASASLNVNVGSFSDEDDMPGMAHAVEHALFMGTKKVCSSRYVIRAPALLVAMFLWNSLIDIFSDWPYSIQ